MFFFDIDETLYSDSHKSVLSQNKKLILELSKNPNNVLGIATGRNHGNLKVVEELLPCFKYLVLINGALVLENNKIIDKTPISVENIEKVLKHSELLSNEGNEIVSSTISFDKSAFYSNNDNQKEIIKLWQSRFEIAIDDEFHLKEEVFMLNLFGRDKDKIKPFLDELDLFQAYYWRTHIDLTVKDINKFSSIKNIKEKYPEHELICTGDGYNDLEMLENADIGVVMGNCEYDEVIEKANLKAPRIEENKLYDFFKENNLF
ncbi:HAD-IIB family hydrolase ['Camptotheca acuminata' phytoplasma]|uniref:HAD-IIB family hydrolase n=1 Tax='Camptotheca acuminata' phytoplasma TaxID=3239192 RepID=UPI00351A5717